MLDKSVPYKVVIMKMPGERLARIQPQVLPKGFKYRFYVSGDEEQWCDRIFGDFKGARVF